MRNATSHDYSFRLGPGIEVEVESGSEWTSPTLNDEEPDPNWKAVDKAGHGHFRGIDGSSLPTLRWHPDMAWSDVTNEEYDAGWWECPTCKERIRPGTRPATRQLVSEWRRYKMTVRDEHATRTFDLSEDEYRQVEAAVGEAVRGVVDGFSPKEVTYGG